MWHFLLLCVFFYSGFGQAQVGIGTASPDPSALLDLEAEDRGLLLPRVQLISRAAQGLSHRFVPTNGLMVFNQNASLDHGVGVYYYDGSLWQRLTREGQHPRWSYLGQGIGYGQGPVYIGTSSSSNHDLWLSRRIIDWDNSAYYIDPGAVSHINELSLDSGSRSDLSLYWGQDQTGFYSPEDHQLSYVADGIEVLRINDQGALGLKTPDPLADLDVHGSVKLGVTGTVLSGMHLLEWPIEVPAGSQGTIIQTTINTAVLAAQGIPLSAYVNSMVLGQAGAQVALTQQWMDQEGYHCILQLNATVSVAFSLQLKIIALY